MDEFMNILAPTVEALGFDVFSLLDLGRDGNVNIEILVARQAAVIVNHGNPVDGKAFCMVSRSNARRLPRM